MVNSIKMATPNKDLNLKELETMRTGGYDSRRKVQRSRLRKGYEGIQDPLVKSRALTTSRVLQELAQRFRQRLRKSSETGSLKAAERTKKELNLDIGCTSESSWYWSSGGKAS
jgi:hypothetical protein